MSKTPEEMAEEYAWKHYGYSAINHQLDFLAGYKAAQDAYKGAILTYEKVAKQMLEEAVRIMSPEDQLVYAEKVIDICGHILDMEKMVDVNSPEKLDNWISVKDRLPELNEWVLIDGAEVCKRIEPPSSNWKEQYAWETNHDSFYSPNDVTHWMPLPAPPKEEK